jgi:hypothetical protein
MLDILLLGGYQLDIDDEFGEKSLRLQATLGNTCSLFCSLIWEIYVYSICTSRYISHNLLS